jgi:hypothetical protein
MKGVGSFSKGYPPGSGFARTRARRSEGGTQSGTPLGPRPRPRSRAFRGDLRGQATLGPSAPRVDGECSQSASGARRSRRSFVVRAGSSPRGSLRRAGPSAGPAGVSVAARRVPRRTGDWIRGGCSLEATSAGAPEPCPGWPLCGRRRLIPVARYCLRRRAAGCRQGGPACEARGPQGGPAAAARDSSLCAVRVTARGGCSLEATSSGVSTLGLRPGEVAPSKPPPPGYRL